MIKDPIMFILPRLFNCPKNLLTMKTKAERRAVLSFYGASFNRASSSRYHDALPPFHQACYTEQKFDFFLSFTISTYGKTQTRIRGWSCLDEDVLPLIGELEGPLLIDGECSELQGWQVCE